MKMELVFKRLGNSTGLTFPAAFLREHGVREGQTVVVEAADDGTITLQPKAIRKRYTAAQLNAPCDLKAAMPSDLVAWGRGPAGGGGAAVRGGGGGGEVREGDILLVPPDPAAGSEIRGKRPVLVLSNSEFNRVGRALVAAIAQGGNVDRVRGWAVSLMGTGTETQGAVVLSQCRMIDYIERGARHVESVPSHVIEEALAKLQAALDPE